MTMKVLRVKKTSLYDVFTGRGWKNWTRISFDTKCNSLTYVDGQALGISNRNQLHRFLIERTTKNV